MATNRPRADELRQGLTVELVQDDEDPHAADTEPLIGEIAVVDGEDPDGPHVRLKRGVVGHVQSVVADTS